MANGLTPPEVAANIRGAIGNRGEVTRRLGLTQEQAGVVSAAVGHLRMSKGKEALDTLSQGVTLLEKGGWEPVLQARILSDFAPDGTRTARAGTDEGIKLMHARRMMKTYENYSKHGYDGLRGTPAEVLGQRQILRELMQDFLATNPTMRQALAPHYAPHVIPAATVEEALRDDGLQQALAQDLNGILTMPEKFEDKTKALFTARKGLVTEQQSRANLVVQRDLQENLQTGAISEQNAFNTNSNYKVASIPASPMESRLSAIGRLESHLATSNVSEVATFKADLDRMLRLREAHAKPSGGGAKTELDDITKRLNAARTDAAMGASCREFEALYAQRFDINRRIDGTAGEIAKINSDIVIKDVDIATKQAAINDTGITPSTESGDFATSVEQAMHRAGAKYLATRAKSFIDSYKADKTAAITEASAANEEAMDHYMERRWINYRPQSVAHQLVEHLTLNKGLIRNDFSRLVSQGPNAVVADILARSGISRDQQALMLQDKDFMVKKGTEVTGKVLASYAVIGGKIKDRHLKALAVSDYGKEAALNVINTMHGVSASEKEKARAAIEAGFTKGVPPDLYDRIINSAQADWSKNTLKVLLSPMKLLRPGAIQMGKLVGTIDVDA